MLVISRKREEGLHIGPDIHITVLRAGDGRVRLGITAPPGLLVLRDELAQQGLGPAGGQRLAPCVSEGNCTTEDTEPEARDDEQG